MYTSKEIILSIVFFLNLFIAYSQVIAYDASIFSSRHDNFCFDLYNANSYVKGHQINVSVSYHPTAMDAINYTSALKRLYSNSLVEEVIYARVVSNIDDAYATSEVLLAKLPPLAPPGLCGINVCDIDNSGDETINLLDIICFESISNYDDNFCSSTNNELVTLFYLTENDAINETNEQNNVFTLTESLSIYRKIKNNNTGEYSLMGTTLGFINCSEDTDSDGIIDYAEDVNNNLYFIDDDTDKDSLKNYEDPDDDNDGILTINEDYNNNGDPTDDDTDSSGVPDYLEANVTLNHNSFELKFFKIYPNPAINIVNIEFMQSVNLEQVNVYDIFGNTILQQNKNKLIQNLEIDVSKFSIGIYFINLITNNGSETRKLIIK